MTTRESAAPWEAPQRAHQLGHELSLPGSKSLTNRELVLAALATGPSTIRSPLRARDTGLMASALRVLGAKITDGGEGEYGPDLVITPFPAGHIVNAHIECGLAGTVMRFVPPLAALLPGTLTFDGDVAARRRPMATTLDALRQLGVTIDAPEGDRLPFSTFNPGGITGGVVRIDASASSQFVSGLLVMAARLPQGIRIEHQGDTLPSIPHIDMTLKCLRARGIDAEMTSEGVWVVKPGPIAASEVVIEPDLSNAAPFLAAPLITGGTLSVGGWPDHTAQVGALLPGLLERFGAKVVRNGATVTVDGGVGWRAGHKIRGVEMDLSHAGELAPNLITLAALSEEPSRFTGIGHLRGHETDRLSALVDNIRALGGKADETTDGISLEPSPLDGGAWKSFEDHRMATSGALIGLAIRGVVVDDISCTSKTLPEFPALWDTLVKSPAP
jgi:3-phosphoshikimate 1-carboxyvinyltransferase